MIDREQHHAVTTRGHRGAAALAGSLAGLALALAPAGASASSVLYQEGGDLWLSSLDGAHRLQVTTDGAGDDGQWSYSAHAADGSFVAARGRADRWILQRFAGPRAERAEVQVLPRKAYAGLQVFPLSMGIDPGGQFVAYMHSSCSWACQSVTQATWLTFSDRPSNTTDPPEYHVQYARFAGRRLMGSSGGEIVVQPDRPEAPFTHDFERWLSADAASLGQAAVSTTGGMVAVTWSANEGDGAGIVVGRTSTIPGPVGDACDLPVQGVGGSVSFSPDGRHVAWQDDRGVVVAGAPNLAAGVTECALSEPVRVISAAGRGPSLGGADVAAILAARAPAPPPASGGGGETGGGTTGTGTGAAGGTGAGAGGGTGGGGTAGTPAPAAAAAPAPRPLRLAVPRRTTVAALRRGLRLRVTAPRAGRVTVTATVTPKVARRLGLRRARTAALRGARSSGVVVARGTARARRAGAVTVRLRPVAAARRRLVRLRRATLTVRAAQGPSRGLARLRVR